MDRGSKVLILSVVFLTLLSVAATFFRTLVLEDFEMIYEEEDASDEGGGEISEELEGS